MVGCVEFALWSTIVGLLLVVVALGDSYLERLPLSAAMLYGLVGIAVSPAWLDLAAVRPMSYAGLLEHLAEIVMLLSLFTSGLKMSLGLGDGRWLLPLRLAVVSMLVTVALTTVAAVWWLGLPLGAAMLLGGMIAPTDPVLASEVQLADPGDRDRLRFALTGEAGLNDGTAFPFVMLGLGVLGLHELGDFGWRWFAVDVVWASSRASWSAPRSARASGDSCCIAPQPPGGDRPRQLPRARPDRARLRRRAAGARLRLPGRVRGRLRAAARRAARDGGGRRSPARRAARGPRCGSDGRQCMPMPDAAAGWR